VIDAEVWTRLTTATGARLDALNGIDECLARLTVHGRRVSSAAFVEEDYRGAFAAAPMRWR